MLSRLCLVVLILRGFEGLKVGDVATIVPNKVTDYYWREYNDVIPNDALPGGADKNGNPTYIGQAYDSKGILPVTIFRGSKIARGSYGKELFFDKYVKILCSDHPERYEWFPVRIDDLHLLADCHLVIGGNQENQYLNIGRVYYDGETIIGKIKNPKMSYKGLWIPTPGNHTNFSSFEVLTYGCNLPYYRYIQDQNATNSDL